MGREWTADDKHALALLYEPFGPRLCAERLERSETAVRVKFCRLVKEQQYLDAIRKRKKQRHVEQFQLTTGE
jgi:hypothetical protein